MDPSLYAAAGAALVAVLNELRARSRARAADLDRNRREDELARLAALSDQITRRLEG